MGGEDKRTSPRERKRKNSRLDATAAASQPRGPGSPPVFVLTAEEAEKAKEAIEKRTHVVSSNARYVDRTLDMLRDEIKARIVEHKEKLISKRYPKAVWDRHGLPQEAPTDKNLSTCLRFTALSASNAGALRDALLRHDEVKALWDNLPPHIRGTKAKIPASGSAITVDSARSVRGRNADVQEIEVRRSSARGDFEWSQHDTRQRQIEMLHRNFQITTDILDVIRDERLSASLKKANNKRVRKLAEMLIQED